MIRLTTFAAMAALIASSASAQEIHDKLTGKSAEQARAEVDKAVRQVCVRATIYESFRHIAIDHCIRNTGDKALAELETKLAASKTQKTLASR